MLENYEVISNPKINYSQTYIDYKKRRLLIKGIRLPNKNYVLILKRESRVHNGQSIFIAFVPTRIYAECKPLTRSSYGYYSFNISEAMDFLHIERDTNVSLRLEEEDDELIVYELIV